MSIKSIEKFLDAALIFLSIFVLPSIFLFNLYLRNRQMNIIPFHIVVVTALFLGFVSFVLFFISLLITKSKESGLIIVILFWVLFWTFGQTFEWFGNFSTLPANQFTIGLFILVCLLLFFFWRYSFFFDKLRPVFRILPVAIVALFMFNSFPSFSANRINGNVSTDLFRIEFVVDPSLPTPDIFWIMPDSKLSLETLGSIFGEPLSDFRDAMEERGFLIYSNAMLYTGLTNFAVVGLFSPDYYDKVLHELYVPLLHLTGEEWRDMYDIVYPVFASSNPYSYHEILAALRHRNYEINFISHTGPMFFRSHPDRIYDIHVAGDSPMWHSRETFEQKRIGRMFAESGDLPKLLSLTTPLIYMHDFVMENFRGYESMYVPELHPDVEANSLVSHDLLHERRLMRLFHDALTLPSPKFVFAVSYFTHNWGLQMGDAPWRSIERIIDRIAPAHVHSAEVLLNMIDLILETNPYAVIVIQSDHGIHSAIGSQVGGWDYLLQYDFTNDELFELKHSVFSAVRIPEKYGGLDAPIAPLNIARVLVNRFVGQNYTLLP